MTTPDLDLRRVREAIIREHEEAENRGDLEATLATFAGTPRYDVTPGGRFDGAKEVSELLSGIFAAMPDFHATTLALHHADDAVIVETRTTGTHTGSEWFGIPARGHSMALRAVSIYEFEGDRLILEKLFFDGLSLQQQLLGETQQSSLVTETE